MLISLIPNIHRLFLLSFQFRDVAIDKYLRDESTKNHLHVIMSDFFLGTWSGGRKKTYV